MFWALGSFTFLRVCHYLWSVDERLLELSWCTNSILNIIASVLNNEWWCRSVFYITMLRKWISIGLWENYTRKWDFGEYEYEILYVIIKSRMDSFVNDITTGQQSDAVVSSADSQQDVVGFESGSGPFWAESYFLQLAPTIQRHAH